MSLSDILSETFAQSANRFPPEVREIMQKANAEVDASGAGDQALKKGDALPNATLTSATGEAVSIHSLLGKGPLILNFYRGGWCPYCNLELKAYQDLLGEISGLGGQLVAISPEKPDQSLSTIEKNELSFPVLTDDGHGLAQALGIVFELPPALQELYGKFGMDLPTLNAETGWTLPIPATFVVASDGTIALSHVERNYTTRLEPSIALDALRSVATQNA